MPVLSIQLHRAHKQQKRTALEMLTLSGVVRPSHVEPRYATPIARITAFRTTANCDQAYAASIDPYKTLEIRPHIESQTGMVMDVAPSSLSIQLAKNRSHTS